MIVGRPCGSKASREETSDHSEYGQYEGSRR